jgi:DNA-binding transcriptional MerR regulator
MKAQNVKSAFAIHEVVALTGFSKYMLDYLVRDAIFVPTGRANGRRGARRQYTYSDVVILRALHAICVGKGKIRHLKEALTNFRSEFGQITPGQKLESLLFVLGDELYVYTAAEGGRHLRSGQGTLSFVIDLGHVSKEIADCVVVNRETHQFSLTPVAARKAEDERQRIWAPMKARRLAR